MIELGYLSALLERHCCESDNLLSHKFEVIKKFLEDVIKIVPFESIAYAIANGNYQTAMQCSKALTGANVKVPVTKIMYTGLRDAINHLQYGVPTSLLVSLETRCRAFETEYSWSRFQSIYLDSGKLVYESFSDSTLTQSMKVQADIKNIQLQSTNVEVAGELRHLKNTLFPKANEIAYSGIKQLVSKLAIEELYPIHCDTSSCLMSPLNILVNGRKKLAELSVSETSISPSSHSNKDMLMAVNSIRYNQLDMCTSLLGGFMHQGTVGIVLSSNKHSQVRLSDVLVYTPTSVGVWALFSLDYDHVQPILTQCQDEQLLVRLFDYVKGISGISHEPESDDCDINPYAAKLQFMAQGMTKTVTCDTQHVSYSLERQLVELCNGLRIDAATPLSEITGKWSVLFKGKTLSLVHYECRHLIALWLKWALMIHNLREELAKYTAVGVVGLVNSGKSKLVNTLFGIKVYIAISMKNNIVYL